MFLECLCRRPLVGVAELLPAVKANSMQFSGPKVKKLKKLKKLDFYRNMLYGSDYKSSIEQYSHQTNEMDSGHSPKNRERFFGNVEIV